MNRPPWEKAELKDIGLKRLVTYHFVLSGSYEYQPGRHFTTSILAADVLAKLELEYPAIKPPPKATSSKKAEQRAKGSRKTKPASEEHCTTIRG